MDKALTSAVVAAALTAIISSSLAYFFAERAKKKKTINEALARVVAAGRIYRNAYIRMVEYDIDLSQQQKNMVAALKQKEERIFEVHKDAALIAQKTAMKHQDAVATASSELIESFFLLSAFLNRKVHNYKIQEEVNGIIGFILRERGSFETAKREVDGALMPRLIRIEKLCNRLLWEQNVSPFVRLKERATDFIKKKYKK